MATLSIDHDAPNDSAGDVAVPGMLDACVADPVVPGGGGWQIGTSLAPTPPSPATARAARLEARLAVYAQYAAVVAEEAVATVAGDLARRDALSIDRGAAAEHFAELRASTEHDEHGTVDFSVALTDALHELRHQDAVDDALGRRLRALRDSVAARGSEPEPRAAISAGAPGATRLDVRF